MTMFFIGLGAIAALIGITILVDMPPIDEFGCSLKGEGWDGRGFGMTGIVGLIWLTGAAVVGLVLGLVEIAVEEVLRRRNG